MCDSEPGDLRQGDAFQIICSRAAVPCARAALRLGMMLACPLCGGGSRALEVKAAGRRLQDCECCGLVFVEPQDRPDAAYERSQYLLHENDPSDLRYRGFLEQLTTPLAQRLKDGAVGLDFGCGPGPAIRPMMAEKGFKVRNYDPFFFPDPGALLCAYDFITCTEVVEHLHAPRETFDLLRQVLRPGGVLGLMTSLIQPDTNFSTWAYARDPTHVVFYRPATLRWIARAYGWRLTSDDRRVALLERS